VARQFQRFRGCLYSAEADDGADRLQLGRARRRLRLLAPGKTSLSRLDTLRWFRAFGMTVSRTGSTATPFGFVGAGQYQSDADSGLMLLGHRMYLRHEVAQAIVTRGNAT
jgi:hypothetical protein